MGLDILPRRRQRQTYGGSLIQKLEEKRAAQNGTHVGSPINGDARTVQRHSVPCSRHEERDFQGPCVLAASLQEGGLITPNALLRVRSRQQPELRFYARAHQGSFAQSVKGISILRSIADQAKMTDKEVELEEVAEEEARLDEVVMVLGDCYMSSRDVWHLHLAMMQEGGQILYHGFERNLWPHTPRSRVEKMGAKGKELVCGLVKPSTDVVFKSGTANLFVLIQVSAELFSYGLAGRPYWQVLLDCFAQLFEKALKVPGSEGNGHYVHMVLFARAKRRDSDRSDEMRRHFVRSETTRLTPSGEYEDFYDVFWEGFVKAMPPPAQLLSRVRQACVSLHERSCGFSKTDENSKRDAWSCIDAGQLVEARYGNVLECLNLVLDNFENHHLDRMVKVSGQAILLLTAGSGLIHTQSRELYEVTHQRFVAGDLQRGFHAISVREPPLHPVPWVSWPGSPRPCDPVPGDIEDTLPPQPPWLTLVFHKEVSFCPSLQNVQWTRSSFLPLERLRPGKEDALHVPRWDEAQCGLRPNSKAGQTNGHAGVKQPMSPVAPPRQCGDEFWHEVRLPRLRSYFKGSQRAYPYEKAVDSYLVYSSLFSDSDWECINLMSDLIGLRLAALGSAQLCRIDGGVQLWEKPNENEPPIKEPWAMQGSLIPETLHGLVVRCASGKQWSFEPCEAALKVSPSWSPSAPALDVTYRYDSFYVRQQIVRRDEGEDQACPSSLGSRNVWIPTRRVFHLQEGLAWNELDAIIAGGLEMPPALPYPVQRQSGNLQKDHSPGWRLRGALKQHLFVLVPKDETERSHADILRCARQIQDGEFEVGMDPFDVLEDDACKILCRGDYSKVRNELLKKFAAFKLAFEDLCFGKADRRETLNISFDLEATSFEVKRGRSTVFIRSTNISSAFPHSRDRLEIFYDSIFSPPKNFHLVLQWIACSSVHITNIVAKLVRIAEDAGFSLVRLPILQLFPQPAPHWVWSDDPETNFDRATFYPRRKLRLPAGMDESARKQLYGKLLECWVEDHGFIFIFSSATQDFNAMARPRLDWQHKQQRKVYQRLKGWVLSDPEGLCIIALRKDFIHWTESGLVLVEARDSRTASSKLQEIERLRCQFFAATEEILAKADAAHSDWNFTSPRGLELYKIASAGSLVGSLPSGILDSQAEELDEPCSSP